MSAFFNSLFENGLDPKGFIICTVAALLCGIICAFAAAFKSTVSKSFLTALILLPVIVETVILMVNGNVGTGVAVMGAFSLVRFRSVPGRARDIVFIFLAMTSGLACAAGYAAIAIAITILVAAASVVIALIPFAEDKLYELRITIPESISYGEVFAPVFEKYTRISRLSTTKTTNMGSLFKLTYKIELKDEDSMKEFIDELRCRNGNLEITVSHLSERNEEL